ncbi:MAG: group III truncated hemoglobin [Candidatus Hydrogenedentes bacterium]|nr:group III truncated hemoglobin [Candidatus Hydrogenedentota bacterium]
MTPLQDSAQPARRDIESPEDIIHIVDSFYAIAITDSIIGHFFTEVIQINLEEHLPRLYRFWCAIILGMPSYRENAFMPHILLHQKSPMEPHHFERWLALFSGTIDSRFEGPRASLAKKRAEDIATAMAAKLAHLDSAAAVSTQSN